ncbi:hypothetical protein NM688_g2674 [Phlebia brevispora]|uniref:Uncharacterized protein n=1 Tax=Phlebia brevispora TaxID=194682 RepID=A0ACC1T7U3_9APHY|nr:hypothetical protein NM688_g2674 [Phlebia brevispora]
MHLLTVLSILLAFAGTALASTAPHNDNLHRRQQIVMSDMHGASALTASHAISSSHPLSFNYTPFNWCFEAFSGVSIWLVPGPDAPSASSLNETQGFSGHLAAYGDWIYGNFGGKLAPGPPPPVFPVPELDPSFVGSTVYVTVVENLYGCPPIGIPRYIVSSIGVTYTG